MRLQIARSSYSKHWAAGIKHGYRSGLEKTVRAQLEQLQEKYKNFIWDYEPFSIPYYKVRTKGECYKCGAEIRTQHDYTPDFVITFNNGHQLFVETKGRWLPEDRTKHTYIHKQHPELDIRFVFNNPAAKLSKGAATTYAQWCGKKKIPCAKALIPESWITEQL